MYVNGTASVESIPQHRQDAFLTDCFTQASVQNAQVFETKGHAESETIWDREAEGGLVRGVNRPGR
jgi:hypothetical protein